MTFHRKTAQKQNATRKSSRRRRRRSVDTKRRNARLLNAFALLHRTISIRNLTIFQTRKSFGRKRERERNVHFIHQNFSLSALSHNETIHLVEYVSVVGTFTLTAQAVLISSQGCYAHTHKIDASTHYKCKRHTNRAAKQLPKKGEQTYLVGERCECCCRWRR